MHTAALTGPNSECISFLYFSMGQFHLIRLINDLEGFLMSFRSDFKSLQASKHKLESE